MEVLRFSTAQEFLDATSKFRSSEMVRTNLITSIAGSVANGSRTYDDYFWWAVKDGNVIQGIAIRTVPFGYVLSPMTSEVLTVLYLKIAQDDNFAREFSGPKAVIDFLPKLSGLQISESSSELIYENRKLTPVDSIGEIKVAQESDFEVIYDWMKKFMEFTGLRSYDLEKTVRTALDVGRFHLLLVDGIPVSLGGHSDVQNIDGILVGRVGPIYTPDEYRKNGYASALTSELTKKLIAKGALPTLYTQAENPTSNKIYQDIGYTLVDENRRIVLS